MTATDLDRLLAAGDALAAEVEREMKINALCDGVPIEDYPQFALTKAWRALAREVRKEKGDDASAHDR